MDKFPVGKYAVQGAERLEGSVIESKTTVSGAAMTVDIDKALFPGKTSKTISGMRILLYTDGRAIRPGNLISLPSRLEEIGRLPFSTVNDMPKACAKTESFILYVPVKTKCRPR